MRVLAPEARPVADAQIEVGLADDSIRESTARTLGDGTCSFPLASSSARCEWVHVVARGFSQQLVSSPGIGALLARTPSGWTLTLRLRAPAGLDALVTDQDGAPLAAHFVVLNCCGSQAERDRDRTFSEGTLRTRTAITGADGHLVLDDLEPGWWSLHCEPWRDKEPSEEVSLRAEPNTRAQLTLVAPSLPRERLAAGRIRLGAAQRLSDVRTINDLVLEDSHERIRAAWLYEGGQFFLTGEPGETVELHLVRVSDSRRSRAFPVVIGQLAHDIQPEWEP